MYNIAILIPLCSRNQNYEDFDKTPFIDKFLPHFNKTKEDIFNYKIFIGIDDDDKYYIEHKQKLIKQCYKVLILDKCQNAPAFAWNKLALEAYNDKDICFDYFFQVGDDVQIISKRWTSRFINKLQSNNNIGIVGPINLTNYNQRVDLKIKYVIENAFVHRTHMDIFKTFFHPKIKNWFCDDWITSIYRPFYCEIQKDIVCFNNIRDSRYKISRVKELQLYIKSGISSIEKYEGENLIEYIDKLSNLKEDDIKVKNIFSYCLYGNQKKYCLGMLKNIQQIEELFPNFEIYIHLGNDVPNHYVEEYIKYDKVKLIKYDCTGIILMTYRFFSYDDIDVDMMLLRDADSRFTERDVWIINDFVKSNDNIFTIRDHPYHTAKIMGGQSGFRNIDINFKDIFENEWKNTNGNAVYWYDQKFLDFAVYKRFIDNFIVYTNNNKLIYNKEKWKKILVPRQNDFDFCGNVVLFDKNDNETYEFKL